jgi:hypothetical protein
MPHRTNNNPHNTGLANCSERHRTANDFHNGPNSLATQNRTGTQHDPETQAMPCEAYRLAQLVAWYPRTKQRRTPKSSTAAALDYPPVDLRLFPAGRLAYLRQFPISHSFQDRSLPAPAAHSLGHQNGFRLGLSLSQQRLGPNVIRPVQDRQRQY